MEDVDEIDEEAEADHVLGADIEVSMHDEIEDMNDGHDDELVDNRDPFTDSPSQSISRARFPSRAITSIPSPTHESASGSSQASGAVDGPPRSYPAPQPKPSQSHPSGEATQPGMPFVHELLRPQVRPEAVTAQVYDIVPTIAAPHSTSINAVTATPDLRWVFTGGADGYIRKFSWVDTVNGRAMLTVAQRHPFVDSVTKAGVLLSYWENEEPQRTCIWASIQGNQRHRSLMNCSQHS